MILRFFLAVYLAVVSISSLIVFSLLIHIASPIEYLFRKKYTGNFAFFFAMLFGKTILFLMRPFWKINFHGLKELRAMKAPIMMVANHQSLADIFIVNALGVQFKGIGKAEAFKIPLFGTCLMLARFIPVKRQDKQSRHHSLEGAIKMIEEGHSMLLFPEGTRSRDGQLLPFKMGAFVLAEKFNLPVVPIVISGANRLIAARSMSPRCGTANVYILPPLHKPVDQEAELFAEAVKTEMAKKLNATS